MCFWVLKYAVLWDIMPTSEKSNHHSERYDANSER